MISNKDKINALVSLKFWFIERQLYEVVGMIRDLEKKLLEETQDYVKVIKDIEYLSSEQKQYLLGLLNKKKFYLMPTSLRDLKITLIQN